MTEDEVDVLHVMWRGEVGGAERAVFQLALHQHERHERSVGLVYGQGIGQWADEARSRGVPVYDLGLRNGHDLSRLRAATRTLRRGRLHHFHGVEMPLIAASCAVPGAARVYTHRGGFTEYTGRQKLRYRVAAPVIRSRFKVTGNTHHGAAAARWLFGIRPDVDVPATYNGMDFSLLDPRRGREEVRREHGAGAGTVVVGTAANLRAWKRIDWLIEAAGQLPEADWALWILGDGPDRARLEALAAASPARERIRFLGRSHHVADFLHAMDAFALVSGPLESFGNAAVEAMACGLPTIVARSSPGLVEHMPDEDRGFVIDGVADLAERMAELVADAQLRERVGQAGRRHVRETYTMDRCLDRYEAVYRELLTE